MLHKKFAHHTKPIIRKEERKQKEEEGGMISHTALCAIGSVILGQTFKRESCSELECILEYGSFGKAYILVPAFSEFIEDLPLFVVQLLFQVLAMPCSFGLLSGLSRHSFGVKLM